MTDTVEAIVAEMREASSLYPADIRRYADRLQSAHDAEVALNDRVIDSLQRALFRWVPSADYSEQAADDAMLLVGLVSNDLTEPGQELRQRAESAESRLREAPQGYAERIVPGLIYVRGEGIESIFTDDQEYHPVRIVLAGDGNG